MVRKQPSLENEVSGQVETETGDRLLSSTVNDSSADLARLDESGITPEHWKSCSSRAWRYFTDAYDLFIIGVAIHLIKTE
jgi:hypothetical protein